MSNSTLEGIKQHLSTCESNLVFACINPPIGFSFEELEEFFRDNFSILVEHEILTGSLIEEYKSFFNAIGIFHNESVKENQFVIADGDCSIVANSADVYAIENASVKASFSNVIAKDNAQISAEEKCEVLSFGNSSVYAYDNCFVDAYNNSYVCVYDKSSVYAYDNTTVDHL